MNLVIVKYMYCDLQGLTDQFFAKPKTSANKISTYQRQITRLCSTLSKIFVKYFSCCTHPYCFDSLGKKNISLDHSVTSPVYIPLFQVRKMWSSQMVSTDTTESSSDMLSSLVTPPAENGLPVKLLLVRSKSWLLECHGSGSLGSPESDIPVTLTQLECDSPARFAQMGVENKGTASRINQPICL